MEWRPFKRTKGGEGCHPQRVEATRSYIKSVCPYLYKYSHTDDCSFPETTTVINIKDQFGPCRKSADIVFVIDTTTNMNYDYYITYLLGFVQNLTQMVDVDGGRTRIGAIGFSETASVEFYLNNFTRTVDILGALRRVKYGGYDANLAEALFLLRTALFTPSNGARQDLGVSRTAVIITENVSMNQTATLIEAGLVMKAGIGVAVVGVGTYLNNYELSAVASYPYNKTLFTVGTARNLSQLQEPIKRLICSGSFTDGWMDGWMKGWMDGWKDGWMDGWLDGWLGR